MPEELASSGIKLLNCYSIETSTETVKNSL